MAKILVIDDQRSIRNTLKDILEYEDHSVELAEHGEEGVEKFKADKYDVVLCDIKMPNMDGITTTRTIRESSDLKAMSDIPIVALTAHAMKGDKERFLGVGMDDYLAKPVEFVDLVSVLSRIASIIRKRES